jgi:hypothetical protein
MSEVDKAKLIAEFHKKMASMRGDAAGAHGIADYFLLGMLRRLGHGDVADACDEEETAFDGWWYA